MRKKLHLAGIKNIFLPRPKEADLMKTSAPRRCCSSPRRRPRRAKEAGTSWIYASKWLSSRVSRRGTCRRLSRIIHERRYRDGEVIYEQGQPGTALYLVRGDSVEIVRRKWNREEVPLAMLEPLASFEDLAAIRAEVIR
jgi:hypothetical protein